MKNLFFLTLLLGATGSSHAVVTSINSIGYTGTLSDGSAVLTTVTTAGGTFNVTSGAVTVTSSAVSFGERFWRGTQPANDAAAVTGLNLSNGLLNLGSSTSRYDFGTTFTESTRFFILDATQTFTSRGDPATIELTNSAGTILGTYTLALTASSYGGVLATVADTTREGTGTVSLDYSGVSFALSDFAGTGDLSSATGIRISNASNLDPVIVGIYTVPEPSSAIMFSAAACGFAFIRKRRKTAIR